MRSRRALSAAILATGLAAGEMPLRAEVLGAARDAGLLRVAVARPAGAGAGDARLTAVLSEGGTVRAVAELAAVRPAQLAEGVVLVLAPEGVGMGACRLTVTAVWPGTPPREETASLPVPNPGAALAEAVRLVERLREGGEAAPLPWLWAEQVAELVAGGSSLAAMSEVEAAATGLRRWLEGWRPPVPCAAGTTLLALRDPVDGSVQPVRLHLPPGPGPFPLAVVLGAGGGKARWPELPAAELAAATAAGLAVVACYAAGDAAWTGAAARRIGLAIDAARQVAPLDPDRVAVVGAPGAPLPWPVRRPDPQAASAPAWWAGLPLAGRGEIPLGPADLAAALRGPFAVVVGTAEHRAAVAANRRLADAFVAAYARHAHAVVRALDDTADPSSLAGRNLVLIGSPRSNRVLARLAPGLALPFTWDHRRLRSGDGQSYFRAAGPFAAWSGRLGDGRIVLVLDGAPPPWGDGLPLAGAEGPLLLPPSGR